VDKKNQLDVTFCTLYFSSNSCSTCFGQPCPHHQELTTAWCYSLVLVCAVTMRGVLCLHKQIGPASNNSYLCFGGDEFESPKYPQANDRIAGQIRSPPLPCKFFSKSPLINHGTILCCIVSATKSSKKPKINLSIHNQSYVTATLSFFTYILSMYNWGSSKFGFLLSNVYNYRIYNNPII
jgi:hypothetical protein